MALLKRPNGTEDILPGASAEWQALENFLRETAHVSGFQEIRIPTFEQTPSGIMKTQAIPVAWVSTFNLRDFVRFSSKLLFQPAQYFRF